MSFRPRWLRPPRTLGIIAAMGIPAAANVPSSFHQAVASLGFFDLEKLKTFVETHAYDFGVNLLGAIAVFVIGRLIAKLIVRALGAAFRRLDDSLSKFLQDLAYALMLAVVVIAALDRIGVPTTSAVAVLGAAGLAVGLALQSSLGNFASGVMIIVFKPYKVGDVVQLAGYVGKVESIKIFVTTIHTPDNREVIIPNGNITSGSIENLTALGTRRIDLVFGIGYGDDIKKAHEILKRLVAADERILADPEPQIAVSELADSSVNFVVRPWTKVDDYWPVRFDLTEKVKQTFDAEGISIPFPQRDVHMHQAA